MRIARVFAVMVAAVCMVAILAPTVNAQALMICAGPNCIGSCNGCYDQKYGMVKIYTDNTAGDGLTIVAEFRASEAAHAHLRTSASIRRRSNGPRGCSTLRPTIKMASINPDGVGRGMEDPWTVGKVLPTGLTYDDLAPCSSFRVHTRMVATSTSMATGPSLYIRSRTLHAGSVRPGPPGLGRPASSLLIATPK